jgi:hypothetical protein
MVISAASTGISVPTASASVIAITTAISPPGARESGRSSF